MQFNYELETRIEQFKDVNLWVQSLKNLDHTIDQIFEALQKEGKPELLEELCPYFGVVWPSARALAHEILARRSSMRGTEILEFGCGLAVPSLLAARIGLKITAIDFHPAVEEFLNGNVKLNQVSRLSYQRISWLQADDGLPAYDWLIASDVLYEKDHPSKVAEFISRHLKPRGTALIADPGRSYLQNFSDEMTRHGFRSETKIQTVLEGFSTRDIFLLEFTRSGINP